MSLDASSSTQISKKTLPLKIYWHEGMLLSQHLFQQNDLRNFLILAKKMSLISNYNWGIVSIDVDENALSTGIFRLREIEAVFKDGLYIQYCANTQQHIKPLEIKLSSTSITDAIDNEIIIYIAITSLSDQTSPLSGNSPRFYTTDGFSVADENIIGNETVIPGLIPNAFLCYEVPDCCISIPIARISLRDGNFFKSEFTLPCFYISKNSFIWKQCMEIVSTLRNKQNILSRIVNTTECVAIFDYRVALMQLIVTITSAEALLFSEDVKPYELYREMVKILGNVFAISNLSTDVLPTIPSYNHSDINSCILPIIELIYKYISTIDKGYTALPFSKHELFFYKYISQQDIDCAKDKKFYIGIQSTGLTDISNISTWIKNAVIVSDFALDNVRLKRTPGAVRREVTPEIATEIMPGSNTRLFEVEINSRYIKAEQNLHVFNPGSDAKFQPKSIILYLPHPNNGTK